MFESFNVKHFLFDRWIDLREKQCAFNTIEAEQMMAMIVYGNRDTTKMSVVI